MNTYLLYRKKSTIPSHIFFFILHIYLIHEENNWNYNINTDKLFSDNKTTSILQYLTMLIWRCIDQYTVHVKMLRKNCILKKWNNSIITKNSIIRDKSIQQWTKRAPPPRHHSVSGYHTLLFYLLRPNLAHVISK